jgi:hypothetical protein
MTAEHRFLDGASEKRPGRDVGIASSDERALENREAGVHLVGVPAHRLSVPTRPFEQQRKPQVVPSVVEFFAEEDAELLEDLGDEASSASPQASDDDRPAAPRGRFER